MTIEIIDPNGVQDSFCEMLARIERVGSCRRLVFATTMIDRPGEAYRHVVVKLVMPAEALADLAQAIVADDRSEHGGPVARIPAGTVAL
jgi:hypothetical protein